LNAQSFALVFGAAAAAGIVNSVAGGGTILSFPAAVAVGLSAVVANATNCVALTPGSLASAWAYRRELAQWGSTLWVVVIATALGGVTGAAVLLATPEKWFDVVVPWLVLVATLLIVLQGPISRFARGRRAEPTDTAKHAATGSVGPWATALVLFGVGIYGGYFGAGQGIFMLGIFSLVFAANMHEMNALKVLAAAFSNGFAAVYFVVRGVVDGPVAITMAVGAIAGGFAGAAIARRVDPRWVRALVVAIGVAMTVSLLRRAYHHETGAYDAPSRSIAPRTPT
jgi:uncharacterized membrane protein YfcA